MRKYHEFICFGQRASPVDFPLHVTEQQRNPATTGNMRTDTRLIPNR
jgi:hypothetical protein